MISTQITQTVVAQWCQTRHQFGSALTSAGNTRQSLPPVAAKERKMATAFNLSGQRFGNCKDVVSMLDEAAI